MQEQNCLLFITPQGLSGQFTVSNVHFLAGDHQFGVEFTTDLQLAFNTSNQLVNETFNIPGSPYVVLSVPAGPYFRLTASNATIDVYANAGTKYSLAGNFQIEQVTEAGASQVRFAFSNVHADGTVSITDGTGAIILLPGGMAGMISAKAGTSLAGFAFG